MGFLTRPVASLNKTGILSRKEEGGERYWVGDSRVSHAGDEWRHRGAASDCRHSHHRGSTGLGITGATSCKSVVTSRAKMRVPALL